MKNILALSGKQVNRESKPQTAASGKPVSAGSQNTPLYRGFIKYWIPVIVLLGIIFWLSSGTFTSGYTSRFFFPIIHSLIPRLLPRYVSLIHESIRALAHVTEYFFMGILLSRAFYRNSRQIWNLRWSAFIIVLLALLATSDEFYQSFFPSRKASLVGVGLDLIGGFLSQIAMILRGKVTAINNRR
jgi:VanZ family protein